MRFKGEKGRPERAFGGQTPTPPPPPRMGPHEKTQVRGAYSRNEIRENATREIDGPSGVLFVAARHEPFDRRICTDNGRQRESRKGRECYQSVQSLLPVGGVGNWRRENAEGVSSAEIPSSNNREEERTGGSFFGGSDG